LYLEGFEIGSDTRYCPSIPVLEYAKQGTTDYYEGWNFNSGNYLFTTNTK